MVRQLEPQEALARIGKLLQGAIVWRIPSGGALKAKHPDHGDCAEDFQRTMDARRVLTERD